MATSGPGSPGAHPVERFKPTSGRFVGYAGLVFVAVVVGYVAFRVHTVTGLQVALGVLLFGVLTWLTQLRPRAIAYSDRLLLKNSVRDVEIPLVLIDDVSVRQVLYVWAGEQRFVCVGIGRSMKDMVRRRRSAAAPSLLGTSRVREFVDMAEKAAPEQTAMSYQSFVEVRIAELVAQAKKETATAEPAGGPRRLHAWPEIAALAVTGTAFAVSLFL
jgi:hypothetical protein